MPILEKQKKYNAAHIKRVPLDMQKSDYEKLFSAAAACGETVNGYIKAAIRQRMERENAQQGQN